MLHCARHKRYHDFDGIWDADLHTSSMQSKEKDAAAPNCPIVGVTEGTITRSAISVGSRHNRGIRSRRLIIVPSVFGAS